MLLLMIERIEIQLVHPSIRLQLLLPHEEVHAQLLLRLLHLPADPIHGFLEYFEDVDSAIDVHDLAAHGDHDGSEEDPALLLHFGTVHEGSIKIYLFKLQGIPRCRPLGVLKQTVLGSHTFPLVVALVQVEVAVRTGVLLLLDLRQLALQLLDPHSHLLHLLPQLLLALSLPALRPLLNGLAFEEVETAFEGAVVFGGVGVAGVGAFVDGELLHGGDGHGLVGFLVAAVGRSGSLGSVAVSGWVFSVFSTHGVEVGFGIKDYIEF